MKTATRSEEQSSRAHGHHINPVDVLASAPSKASRVLAYLSIPGNSLNRFGAMQLGDSCLNSTISRFANAHDLVFNRITEQVPNAWGAPCTVTRYSLPDDQRRKALAVLALMVAKRKPAGQRAARW